MHDILKAMRPRTYRTKSGSTYTLYPFEGARVRVVGVSVTLGRIELVGEVVQEPDPEITTGPLSCLVVRIEKLMCPENVPERDRRFLHTSPAVLVEPRLGMWDCCREALPQVVGHQQVFTCVAGHRWWFDSITSGWHLCGPDGEFVRR